MGNPSRLLVGTLALLFAACTSEPEPAPGGNPPPGSLHLIAGLETARGPVEGRNGHDATGTAAIFRTAGVWYLSLGLDFRIDGAPDTVVAFGADGIDRGAVLGSLHIDEGTSLYEVAPPLDVGDYTEVWLWSDSEGNAVGYARLTLL